jgi:hypothetical protein
LPWDARVAYHEARHRATHRKHCAGFQAVEVEIAQSLLPKHSSSRANGYAASMPALHAGDLAMS